MVDPEDAGEADAVACLLAGCEWEDRRDGGDPPDEMAETKALAITEEPAGGSPQPTSTPMWVGGIS